MGFWQRYSYLRALFVGLPFGFGCLITGINYFIEIPRNVEGLEVVSGNVQGFGIKRIKSEVDNSSYEVFFVEVEQKGWYYTELKSKKRLLRRELAEELRTSRLVEIWHMNGQKNIEQISVGDKFLYEYEPPYWMGHVFFWIGAITLVSAIGYVVLHPEDLTGKKRNGKVSKW
ncbi:hypothetical protein [Carboxylicivirga taeanensis]|uniref:hypothetical protein n=1 Tax=Carboxylicivirga taeanensis TaxID=1416875 RepID=UPI003F6E24E2